MLKERVADSMAANKRMDCWRMEAISRGGSHHVMPIGRSSRDLDVLLVGATGFTGKLVASYLARRTPHGVLMFATSYAALARLTRRWRSTRLWNELERIKPLFVEPGGAAGSPSSRGPPPSFDSTFARFRAESRTARGAVFFGVFRGKASEGTDFEGDLARAVVLVGIPFPNVKDQRVLLKRQYNDAHSGTLGSGSDWCVARAQVTRV